MNEETPPGNTAVAAAEVSIPPEPLQPAKRDRSAARTSRWGLELVLVFASVLAAFALNGYGARRQQQQRREQLLVTLLTDAQETLTSLREQDREFQKVADDFLRRLEAGETPPLVPIQWSSNYDASDTASLLGSGGYDLLSLETIHQIKEVEGQARNVINYSAHCQQLSDALVLPNADKDPSFFYDPQTRRLRTTYRWYGEFFKNLRQAFKTLEVRVEKLATRLRTERQEQR